MLVRGKCVGRTFGSPYFVGSIPFTYSTLAVSRAGQCDINSSLSSIPRLLSRDGLAGVASEKIRPSPETQREGMR